MIILKPMSERIGYDKNSCFNGNLNDDFYVRR